MNELGRRAFLMIAAMVSPLETLRRAVQQPSSELDTFLAVSARLTGRATLDPVVGQVYLKALLAGSGKVRLLHDLSSDTVARRSTPAHIAVEEEIVTAWYTGTYDLDGQRHLATHSGALMWSALGRAAPGICASARASWSQPPQTR
jgi:hypothetical protein